MPTALDAGRYHSKGLRLQRQVHARPRHRIARALDLGERGEQLGRDHRGRMLAEERSVLAPGRSRRLRQGLTDGEEHLGRLAP